MESEAVRGNPAAGATDLFFAEASVPPLVFQHMRKSGGTSIRQLLGRSLGEPVRLFAPHGESRDTLQAWWREQAESWETVPAAVASHSAAFLVPLLDGCRPVTVIRDPVDRVVSRHAFANRPVMGPLRAPSGRGYGRLLRDLTLSEWLDRFRDGGPEDSEMHQFAAEWFNGQARALLEPWWPVDELRFTTADDPVWERRLAEVVAGWLVAPFPRLAEFAAAVCGEVGKMPHAKRNRDRPPLAAVPAELRDALRSYNWLDVWLYERAREA